MKAIAISVLLCAWLAPAAGGAQPARPPDPSRAGPEAPGPPEAGPRGLLTRRALRMAAWAAAVLLLFVVVVLVIEDKFIFFPTRYPEGEWDAGGEAVEDCYFAAADGVRLHAWWLAGVGEPDGPVLLWFHGNAGNVTHRAENMRLLADRGLSVLIVDYRGYGRSDGSPSEAGIYRDGEAAYEYLTAGRAVAPERILCFGRSLGSAVALKVALERPCAGLILESPMTNARAMARRMLPFVPVWPLIRSSLDNVGRIPALKVPLLVLHGDMDEVVPYEQGRAVFEAAPEPKEFYRIEGSGHNDTYLVGGEPYFRAFEAFCRRCTGREHPRSGPLAP